MRINDFFQRMGKVQQPSAKPISLNSNIDPSMTAVVSVTSDELLEGLLKDWGGRPSPDLREVLKQYFTAGKPVNKEMVQLMEQILQKGEGTLQQKQGIFHLMAQKNIQVSMGSYKAIFQVLHGPSIETLFHQLSDGKEQIPLTLDKAEDQIISRSIRKLDLVIHLLKDRTVEQGSLEKQIMGLQKDIQRSQLLPELKEKFNQVLNEMIGVEDSKSNLQNLGMRTTPQIESPFLGSNQGISQEELTQVVQVDSQLEPKPVEKMEALLKEMQQHLLEGEIHAVQSATFTRIVEFIPQHLQQVGEEFTQIKKQVIQNIERMTQFIDQRIPQAESYVKRVIEPTIDMVNRLIHKGEFALHADMEFEHDVLRISGELQKVKGLLDQGDQKKALEIFQSVRKDFEKLEWQPSITKVENFFSKWTGEHSPKNVLHSFAQDWQKGEITGRGVQEWMRDLGFSHERDALDFFIQRNKKEEDQSGNQLYPLARESQDDQVEREIPRNMKSWLMENMEKEMPAKAKQVMEQALSNVTGQQLLAKPEQNTPMQTMYVQIPLPWEDRTRNVKMEIHSRSQGEKMDWENCHLFFYLDTPKFGETGISVLVINRDITLKFQNDHQGVENFFSPFISKMKESLQEIGYRINKVQFETIQSDPSNVVAAKKNEPASRHAYPNQKGLDLSI